MYASWHNAFALNFFCSFGLRSQSTLLLVYPVLGAIDLSDGRDPPINSFILICYILYCSGVPYIQYMISCLRDMETLNLPICELFFDS